jgi:hypothetical protein
VARPPHGLADQEDLVEVGAVLEVADEHGGQGDTGSGRTSRGSAELLQTRA